MVCVPSGQVPALNDSRELTKVGNLSGLPPAGLHRFDQISQVDLCQVSQPKPVDVPVVHPLTQLHRQTWSSLVDGSVIHPVTQLHRQTGSSYVDVVVIHPVGMTIGCLDGTKDVLCVGHMLALV